MKLLLSRMQKKSRLLTWVMILTLLTGPSVCELPEGWVPVWIDDTAVISDEALEGALGNLGENLPKTEDIVFLVHGFAVPREASTSSYNQVAKRIHAAFAEQGRKASIVGVQWDSDLPNVFFLKIPGLYISKKLYSRRVGRQGMRQLLAGVSKKYPESSLNIFAHSMGCELVGAAIAPETDFPEDDPNAPPTVHDPTKKFELNLVVFAGSDLDYDIGVTGLKTVTDESSTIALWWMTLADTVFDPGDKVLNLRPLIRGKAWGATLPQMSEEDYDYLFSHRQLVVEASNIPTNHKYRNYYNEERISHLVPSLIYTVDPNLIAKPERLAEIDRVLEAPADPEVLRTFLDSKELSPEIYAIWRLEHLFGDGSKHLSDQYLSNIVQDLKRVPRKVSRLRGSSDCRLVREGYWPTETYMARSGAPSSVDQRGQIWQRDFQGEVVRLEKDFLTIRTPFGDDKDFDYREGETEFTPSLEGVRVGSLVKVRTDGEQLRWVHVLRLAEWLESTDEAQRTP